MKYFIPFVAFILLISCASNINSKAYRCASPIQKKTFERIILDKFERSINNKTILINEARYVCTYTAMYLEKGMYDKFGKWNRILELEGRKGQYFVWDNVRLFKNDSTKFHVITSGLESTETTYASVLIFDRNNNDLLAKDSGYKDKLINYFSQLILNDNPEKQDFYEAYWTTINPQHWERIKSYNKKN